MHKYYLILCFIYSIRYQLVEYFIATYIIASYIFFFFCNRYEDETSLSSTTLKMKDNEESSMETSIIPNKLHVNDETPSIISAIMAVGQPEVKYAQPVK